MAAGVDEAEASRRPPFTQRLRPKAFGEWSEGARGTAGAVGVFLLSRFVTILVGYTLVVLSPRSTLLEVLSLWDGEFYVRIAAAGYTGGAMTDAMAFFPAYPLAMRTVTAVSGASPALAGVILSTAGGAAGVAVIWLLVRKLADALTASRTVVLVSFFPAAYVLSMVYPDGPFLFLAAATLLTLLDRRWVLAGVMAGMATAVRPNAVVLVLCCVWAGVGEFRRSRSPAPLLAPLLAPLGGLLYAAYLWIETGTPLTFLRVQEQTWGMRFDFGVSNAQMLLEFLRDPGGLHRFVAVALALAAPFAIYVLIRWRPPAVIAIYAVGIVALALLSSNTTSIVRFVMSAFPLLIPLARRMSQITFAAIAATSAALMVSSFLFVGFLFLNP